MRSIKFDKNTIEVICEYAKTHTLLETCNRFTLKPDTVKRIAKKHDIKFAHKSNVSAESVACSRYSLDSIKSLCPEYSNIREDGAGNVICDKPYWYTGRKQHNTVYMHNVVFCKAVGLTEIPKGFMVYHVDGDKRNMSIDNLVLCTMSCSGKLNTWKA